MPLRKNAMDDVSMSADHGPPSNGCMARLLRRGAQGFGEGFRLADMYTEGRSKSKDPQIKCIVLHAAEQSLPPGTRSYRCPR